MSLKGLLDLLGQKFSPSEGQSIIKCLQQDPLVWQFVQDEEISTKYFEAANNQLDWFSPGKIATWLIEQAIELPLEDLDKPDFRIPDKLKQLGANAFETLLNTGLPPSDLMTAGLLALSLRERRLKKGSWDKIAEDIFLTSSQGSPEKNYAIWRTPFACLDDLCPDYDAFILEFFKSNSKITTQSALPVFIHSFLCNPIEPSALLDKIFNFSHNLSIDLQLETLKWLETFHRPELRESLAKNLLQTRKNIEIIAGIFSELELFKTISDDDDPLNKTVRYGLVEDVNRLAAFYFYSGNEQIAKNTYQKSSDLLDFIKAQTLFQTLMSKIESSSPLKWLEIIKLVPHSKQARLFFIRALIEKNQFDEAAKNITDLPPSTEKNFLQYQIEKGRDENTPPFFNSAEQFDFNSKELLHSKTSFYVHQVKLDVVKDTLRILLNEDVSYLNLIWIEKFLDSNLGDLETVQLVRDLFEKSNLLDKAIELSTYLEYVDPDNKNHKRVLSRLFNKTENWEKAFDTLQSLIKTDPAPETKDLEVFAEAALKTNRLDMCLNICQNILKHEGQNTKALILLGEGYMKKGDVIKAIQHMEQVIGIIPKEPQPRLTLAKLWQENGQTDRSLEILNKATLAIPDEPELLRALGKAYLDEQCPTDASNYLQKAYQLDPKNIDGQLKLAQAKFLLGFYDQAWDLLEPYMESYQNNPAVAKLLGQVLLAMKKNQAAEPVLVFAAEQFPNDLPTVISAAETIIKSADSSTEPIPKVTLDQIGAILQNYSSLNGENPQLQLHLADIDRLQGRNQKALDGYSKLSESTALRNLGLDWRLQFGIGKTALALGNHDVGLAALQQAASNQPGNLLLVHALAEGFLTAGLRHKAQDISKSALKLAPQELDNILWYAQFNVKNNEPEEGIRALREAIQAKPESKKFKLLLSKTLISIGSTGDSKDTLQNLIDFEELDSEELHQAAYIAIQLNEMDMAIVALEKAIASTTTFPSLMIMELAAVYTLLGQHKNALEILNLDEALFAQHPQLALLKSDLLSQLEQYELAFSTLISVEEQSKKQLENNAGNVDAMAQSPLLYHYDFSLTGYFYRLGQLSRAMGDFKKAEGYLSNALSLNSDNEKVRNAAVETFMMAFNFDEAIKLAENNKSTESSIEKFNNDRVDQICSITEILLYQNEKVLASKFFESIELSNRKNPRCLAIQSRLAFSLGEVDLANDHFQEAQTSYQENYENIKPTTLEDLFHQIITFNSLAEAALTLGENKIATRLHEQAWNTLNNQPLLNWRHAVTLISCAESQQIANALSIINHAPGPQALCDQTLAKARNLLEFLQEHLSNDQLMCLNARIEGAFSGKWPLHLSADTCLIGPEEGAAVIISSDDDDLVQDILQTYPEDPLVLQAYGIYALLNNGRDGISNVEKALQMDTSNPINHALLAMLNIEDADLAIKSLETALKFWPDEPEWHALASDLYARIGDSNSATHHISQALKFQPENINFWQKDAEIKYQENDFAHAKESLEYCTQHQSNNPAVWIKMADINNRLGNGGEAIQNIQMARKLDPADEDIISQELKLLIGQKKFSDVEIKAEDILKHNTTNNSVRSLLAQAQAKQGKFNLALDNLAIACENEPKNTELALEKIKIKKDQSGVEAILPELVELAQKHPDDPAVLTTLTDWLIQTNRLEKAEETAKTILKIIPEQPEVHLMLGRLQRKNGQLDQAIAHLSDAITLNPTLVEAYIELGRTYQERRDLEKAIKVFQEGARNNNSDPRPYYHAGMTLKECKDYVGAEEMLKQAKKYAPDDANIIRQLGVITALNLISSLRETG